MNIVFEANSRFEVLSGDDLLKLVPNFLKATVENYGQGEGQIKIENTVWGLYVDNRSRYYLKYEEGVCEYDEFSRTMNLIVEHLRSSLGLVVTVEGQFEGQVDI